MLKVFSALLRKSGWLLLWFAIVVVVLALANDLPGKLKRWNEDANAVAQISKIMQENRATFGRTAREAVGTADAEIAKLRTAGPAELKAADKAVQARLAEAEARAADRSLTLDPEKLKARYQAIYIDVPLLKRMSGLLQTRLSFETRRERHNRAVRQYRRDLGEWKEDADGVCGTKIVSPICNLTLNIDDRREQLKSRGDKLRADTQALKDRQSALGNLRLSNSQTIIDKAIKTYDQDAAALATTAGEKPINMARKALQDYGGTAVLIVLGAAISPILYKLFAFLFIAPLAAQAGSVRLRERGAPLVASSSAISIDVAIDESNELLLRSGLQSSAADIRGDDKPVLDWAIPFTCIAAGLVALQRLRSDRPDHVVVTGTDSHHRVAAINVPEGGAVVLHPRALLGVSKPRDRSLVIARPWRLGALISWITLQFRYIVFHGPCTLIVQGRDGVGVEQASRGRMIDKRLTIGFDAGLAYGAARAASFLPYLNGHSSLFNDRFDGEGCYLFEQRPTLQGSGSVWGRGIKGIGDALLSALGI